jgi:hypothetical protein
MPIPGRRSGNRSSSGLSALQFYKTLQMFTRMPYHAYCTIFCERLATNPRYTTKFKFLIEPRHYFLWVDYELEPLRSFIMDEVCARFLEGPVEEQRTGYS